jgi:hypothetical protein
MQLAEIIIKYNSLKESFKSISGGGFYDIEHKFRELDGRLNGLIKHQAQAINHRRILIQKMWEIEQGIRHHLEEAFAMKSSQLNTERERSGQAEQIQ